MSDFKADRAVIAAAVVNGNWMRDGDIGERNKFIASARTRWPEALDEVERLQSENKRLKRNENTIRFDYHRFTEGGVRGLLEQIEHDNEVCLEHQQERMKLQSENAALREAIKTARERCLERIKQDMYYVDAYELLDMLPTAPQVGE